MQLGPVVVTVFASWFGGINEREPLHEAAWTGNIIHAHLALMRCPDAVNAPARFGKGIYPSLVHIAAGRNNVGVLKLLLAHGGKVDDRGKAGGTPLQLAVSSRSLDTAELLLKSGATLDIFSAVGLNKWKEVQLWFRAASSVGLQKKLANVSAGIWVAEPLLIWAIEGGHLRWWTS